jgi:hypothetical protein
MAAHRPVENNVIENNGGKVTPAGWRARRNQRPCLPKQHHPGHPLEARKQTTGIQINSSRRITLEGNQGEGQSGRNARQTESPKILPECTESDSSPHET